MFQTLLHPVYARTISLRLKYAGFENVNVCENSKETLESFASGSGEIAYILLNYTAMFSTQTNLKAIEAEGKKGKDGVN